MNVLTDAQLDKMAQILNETPEFAKWALAQAKAQQEAAKKSPSYVPGPDSWRPGDPLPVQFKEERNTGGLWQYAIITEHYNTFFGSPCCPISIIILSLKLRRVSTAMLPPRDGR